MTNLNHNEEMENNLIELIDDETGESTMFEHVATIEHEGETYIMVVEEQSINAVDEGDEDEVEALVLKIEKDEQGEDIYVSIEDEDLAALVFEKCLEQINEEFDEE